MIDGAGIGDPRYEVSLPVSSRALSFGPWAADRVVQQCVKRGPTEGRTGSNPVVDQGGVTRGVDVSIMPLGLVSTRGRYERRRLR